MSTHVTSPRTLRPARLAVVLVAVSLLVAAFLVTRGPSSTDEAPMSMSSRMDVPTPTEARAQAEELLLEARAKSSLFAAEHGALPTSVQDLKPYGVRLQPGDHLDIYMKPHVGFCLATYNSYAADVDSLDSALRHDSVTGEFLEPGDKPNPKGICVEA